MVSKRRPTSLMVLPDEMLISIAGHVAASSKRPLDNLRSLGATCKLMRGICKGADIGRRIRLEALSRLRWTKPRCNYKEILANLVEIGNPEACFTSGIYAAFSAHARSPDCFNNLKRAATDGHNLAAYLAAILLFRNNGGAKEDTSARRYMRQVMDEEKSLLVVAGDAPSTRWLGNKGLRECLLEATSEMYATILWCNAGARPLPPA